MSTWSDQLRDLLQGVIKGLFSAEDVEVVYIARVYEEMCKYYYPAIFKPNYVSLHPKDPKNCRNWIHFSRCRDLIKRLGVPCRFFMKAQFLYNNGQGVVYPYMLYSEYAIKKVWKFLVSIEKRYNGDMERQRRVLYEVDDRESSLRDSMYIVKMICDARGKSELASEELESLRNFVIPEYIDYLMGKPIPKDIEDLINKIEKESEKE